MEKQGSLKGCSLDLAPIYLMPVFTAATITLPALKNWFLLPTNFKDDPPIMTNQKGWVITLNNPLSFQEAIQSRK